MQDATLVFRIRVVIVAIALSVLASHLLDRCGATTPIPRRPLPAKQVQITIVIFAEKPADHLQQCRHRDQHLGDVK